MGFTGGRALLVACMMNKGFARDFGSAPEDELAGSLNLASPGASAGVIGVRLLVIGNNGGIGATVSSGGPLRSALHPCQLSGSSASLQPCSGKRWSSFSVTCWGSHQPTSQRWPSFAKMRMEYSKRCSRWTRRLRSLALVFS